MKIHQTICSFMHRAVLPLALFTITIAGAIFLQPARAEEGSGVATLQISPTKNKLGTVQPGDSIFGKFQVQNTGDAPYSYRITIKPYSVSGQDYNPNYTNRTGRTEITDWITVESPDGTVAAHSSNEIAYTVEIPNDVPGGAQAAALVVSLQPNNDEQSSSVSLQTIASAAYILYANIDGETRTAGAVLKNSVPMFLFEPPVVVTSIVENTGNIYTEAHYTLEVRSLLGDNLVYTNVSTQDDGTYNNTRIIFPETSRYNEISWDDAPQLGLFKIRQVVSIFDEESVVEKVVFICPIWFLVILIAIVAIIVYEVVSSIFRIRRDKAIKKALEEKSAQNPDDGDTSEE